MDSDATSMVELIECVRFYHAITKELFLTRSRSKISRSSKNRFRIALAYTCLHSSKVATQINSQVKVNLLKLGGGLSFCEHYPANITLNCLLRVIIRSWLNGKSVAWFLLKKRTSSRLPCDLNR